MSLFTLGLFAFLFGLAGMAVSLVGALQCCIMSRWVEICGVSFLVFAVIFQVGVWTVLLS
jgi:hypothetical protein